MDIKNFSLGFIIGALLIYIFVALPLKNDLLATRTQLDAVQTAFTEEKNKPPKIKTEVLTQTDVSYVPKETVIYKDAVTGDAITVKEKTDIDLNVMAPDIYMKYNGQLYQLPGIKGETNKFQNGKFVGQIASNATIDVTGIVEKETALRLKKEQKHISIGLYGTNKGIAAGVGLINKDWEFKVIATIPDTNKFYGIGIERKF